MLLKKKVVALEEGGFNFGLKVNDNKTEYMVVFPSTPAKLMGYYQKPSSGVICGMHCL